VIFMPLQNWAAGAAPPEFPADEPALGVALLLEQAEAATTNAANSSGSLIKGLDIPIALLKVMGEVEGGGLS
jgi:hypothetical protein